MLTSIEPISSELLVLSPGARALALDPAPYFRRHCYGDSDRYFPAPAPVNMSAYSTPSGELWFVTDDEALLTVCLTPPEYGRYFGSIGLSQ